MCGPWMEAESEVREEEVRRAVSPVLSHRTKDIFTDRKLHVIMSAMEKAQGENHE